MLHHHGACHKVAGQGFTCVLLSRAPHQISFCGTVTSEQLCCLDEPVHIRNVSVVVIPLFCLLNWVCSKDIASCCTSLESSSSEYLLMGRASSQ